MLLGVGLQREAAFGHRLAEAHGGQRVLQRLARAHVHLHVAGGDQRQPGVRRRRASRCSISSAVVGATAAARARSRRARRTSRLQPARLREQRFEGRRRGAGSAARCNRAGLAGRATAGRHPHRARPLVCRPPAAEYRVRPPRGRATVSGAAGRQLLGGRTRYAAGDRQTRALSQLGSSPSLTQETRRRRRRRAVRPRRQGARANRRRAAGRSRGRGAVRRRLSPRAAAGPAGRARSGGSGLFRSAAARA